ncbi:MAG: hypothetical protein ACLTST_07405 [Lachnospiraceae bacterium]
MRIAILTANTEIYREQEEDKAGKVIREVVEAAGHQVVFAKALPLDKKVLSTIMQRMADGQMADLILTQEVQDSHRQIVHRKLHWKL